MIDIILNGCNGKMGQVVAGVAQNDLETSVVAGIDNYFSHTQNYFPTYNKFEECTEQATVIIDFSSPAALRQLLNSAVNRKLPLVIATTGLSPDDLEEIRIASEAIPILRSPNMSLGVNLMYELAQKAAALLGEKFDIEIIEKHHNQKADSPSGTAYALADAINDVLLRSRNYVYGRNSKHQKRDASEIGIHAVRGGTLNGEHIALFAGKDETLQITHTAYSRQIFAIGAIAAAKFIVGKPVGLYSFKDMMAEQSAVTNLYLQDDQAIITVYNVPHNPKAVAGLFRVLGDNNINIDMISQSAPVNCEVDISFTLNEKDLSKAMERLTVLQSDYPSIKPMSIVNISKLTIEGIGMEIQSGVASRVFSILANCDITIRAISTSEIKISLVIFKSDEKNAIEAISKEFGI